MSKCIMCGKDNDCKCHKVLNSIEGESIFIALDRQGHICYMTIDDYGQESQGTMDYLQAFIEHNHDIIYATKMILNIKRLSKPASILLGIILTYYCQSIEVLENENIIKIFEEE